MKELDERFPNHPYQEKLREWRDKILLEDAENRGANLASGLEHHLTKPANDAERKFVVTNGVAAAASERGDELAAVGAVAGDGGPAQGSRPSRTSRMIPRSGNGICWRCGACEQLQNAIKDRREYRREAARGWQTRRSAAGRPTEAHDDPEPSWSNSTASTPTSQTCSDRRQARATRTGTRTATRRVGVDRHRKSPIERQAQASRRRPRTEGRERREGRQGIEARRASRRSRSAARGSSRIAVVEPAPKEPPPEVLSTRPRAMIDPLATCVKLVQRRVTNYVVIE